MDMNSPQHNHMEMERESQIKEMKLKLIIGDFFHFYIPRQFPGVVFFCAADFK